MPEPSRVLTAAARRALSEVRCYRTEHPAALAARHLIADRTSELKLRAHLLAESFGAVPVITTSLTGVQFLGLDKLDGACSTLWSRAEAGPRLPLSKPRRGASLEQRQAHVALLTRWNAQRPVYWVRYLPLYEALQIDLAELQIAGIGWFAYGPGPGGDACSLYLRTAARIPEALATAITAEEYSQIEMRVMGGGHG